MHNRFTLRPPHDDIYWRYYKEGKPLPPELLNRLRWEYLRYGGDPAIVKYYLRPEHFIKYPAIPRKSILSPYHRRGGWHEAEQLQARLNLQIKRRKAPAETKLARAEFFDLILEDINHDLRNAKGETLTSEKLHELLYWHGNQSLTGAPYFLGGLQPVYFFQWGNLMGVVKYEELLGEKDTDGNILIYFEDLKDRTLQQAIEHYLQAAPKIILQPAPVIQPPAPHLTPYSTLSVPRLTLTPGGRSKDPQEN